MTISARLTRAESRLPPNQSSSAVALRRQLTTAKEAGWFVGAFGDFNDYLSAADFSRRDDPAGALALAERVNEQSDGAAIAAYASLDLTLWSEKETIRVSELVKQEHPISEAEIGELQATIFRAIPGCPVARACSMPASALSSNIST